VVEVSGESQKNQSIESTDRGAFYDRITTADNRLMSRTDNRWIQWGFNVLAVLLVAASALLVFRKA
jgi:hypothetical protein